MWKPRADAFIVSGLVVAAIAAVCLALLQPGPFDVIPPPLASFIKDYQTLLSACAALGGVYIAYHNVSRQLSISVATREEERIEQHDTNLRLAHQLLARVQLSILGAEPAEGLEGLGLPRGGQIDEIRRFVEHRLADTDAQTRAAVTSMLGHLWWTANEMRAKRRRVTANPSYVDAVQSRQLEDAIAHYSHAEDRLTDMLQTNQQKLEANSKRLARLRRKIDAIIDEL